MKNIHILPTDKPSRLVRFFTNKFHLCKEILPIEDEEKYQNIYITSSDKEIKEGDWVVFNELEIVKCIYSKNGEFLFSEPLTSSSNHCFSYFKKIILTTDQDLIKDGVQAINDEFLEWFVKNTNCEQISVEEVYFHGSGYYKASELSEQEREKYSFMKKYKIIIPKEEPKTMFESLQEYFKNTSKEKVLEDWNEFQQLDEEGITVKEFLENQKQETFVNEKCFKCGRNQYSSRKPFCTDDFCNKDFYQKPKQETLEEVAKKYSENWEETTGLDYENTVPSEVNKLDFINGAKWQKEQNKNLYSEEEVRQMFNRYNEVIAHRDNEEWQAWIDKQFKKK